LFISVDRCIKVGDFGLSVAVRSKFTQSFYKQKSMDYGISLSNSSDLSTGVGTAIYAAPEVLTSPYYSSKVDIYSLGIIFFEMLHPKFSTGSERAEVLSKLRETGKCPPSFPVTFEKEREIIEWMLQLDPEKRPTSEQLLASEYMPLSTTEEKLSLFFNRKETDLSISKDFNLSKVYYRERAILTLQSAFHLHAAVEFDVEPYMPNSDHMDDIVDKDKICPVMFRSGKLANIAKDGSISLARYLARLPAGKELGFLKRYSFQNFVKKADKSGLFTTQSCSVDIVGSRFKLITDTELLKMMSTALRLFPPKHGEWILRINHSNIIYSILDLCNVPKRDYNSICQFVSKRIKHNYTWNPVIKEKEPTILKDLFRLRGPIEDIHQKLSNILTKAGAREALTDIATLIHNLSIWKIDSNIKVIFDTSLTNDYQRYSGIMFQFGIFSRTQEMYTAIINGGRYDKMINHFTLYEKAPHYVVGCNIKVDKLLAYTNLIDKPRQGESAEETEHEASHFIPPFESGVPQVLVYSENRGIREERMRVANLLWDAGIKVRMNST